MGHLESEERRRREQRRVHETLFTLLSYEKIAFHDIQFRPYRTDEYIHKLFYETSRFTAFNLQWVVKARVNDDQRDPTQSCQRHLSFQLCLKSKINNAMTIHYMLLKVKSSLIYIVDELTNFVLGTIWRNQSATNDI